MSFKLSNTYLKLFIMTAAASAMLVGSESCKSSKDHSKSRNEADTSLKSPV